MATVFIIGPAERTLLRKLREIAAKRPIDMAKLVHTIKTPDGKHAHTEQMNGQTVVISRFLVTYSVEYGHPVGTCRHVSVSTNRRGRVPVLETVWIIAQELGFIGDGRFDGCKVWPEEMQRGPDEEKDRQVAINVVQPVAFRTNYPTSNLG